MNASFQPIIIHRTLEMYDISQATALNVTYLDQVYHINSIDNLYMPADIFIFTATKQVR